MESQVAGLTHTAKAVIAVGQWSSPEGSPAWIIRRSTDGGESWNTVDHGVAGFKASSALAVATGPAGELYAAGQVQGAAGKLWIIRKSVDDGQSWKTAMLGNPLQYSGLPSGISVDGHGVVYVAGTLGLRTRATWVVIRSTDGGGSWATVDSLDLGGRDSMPTSLVAGKNGEVWVGGTTWPVAPPVGFETWTVRFSPDGLHWQTADQFRLGTPRPDQSFWSRATGATMGPGGEVVFTGFAADEQSNYHWIVRGARAEQPFKWATVDDYEAATEGALAIAQSAAFAEDGELYVTGTRIGPKHQGSRNWDLLIRQGYPGAPFVETDVVRSSSKHDIAFPNFLSGQSGYSTTVVDSGSIITAGAISASPDRHSEWAIRRLGCE